MGKYHLPLWLQAAIATSGGLGLGLLAFLDSTFLPFPSVNDLLLVDLSIQNPGRMPYYVLMSTLGSVLGCLLLYYIGRKGEEAAFHDKAGEHAPRIHRGVKRNGFYFAAGDGAAARRRFRLRFSCLPHGARLGMPLRTTCCSPW